MEKGDKIWVEQEGGDQRAAVYAGQSEVRTVGIRAVRLYPLFHPAAALYTPRMLETLREDFSRIPALLAEGPPPQPEPFAEEEPEMPVEPEVRAIPDPEPAPQLGLF